MSTLFEVRLQVNVRGGRAGLRRGTEGGDKIMIRRYGMLIGVLLALFPIGGIGRHRPASVAEAGPYSAVRHVRTHAPPAQSATQEAQAPGPVTAETR